MTMLKILAACTSFNTLKKSYDHAFQPKQKNDGEQIHTKKKYSHKRYEIGGNKHSG